MTTLHTNFRWRSERFSPNPGSLKMSPTSVKRARNVLRVVKKPEKCTLHSVHRISHGSIILNFNFLVTPEYSQPNEQKGSPYPLHKNGMIAWCFCARARRAVAWSVSCISRDSDTVCRLQAVRTEWLQSWCNSCALFCFYFFIILMAMILSRNRSILQVQVR